MDEFDMSESFCRICAKQSDKIQNLFENNYNGVILSEILTHCIKRPVSKTDCLPRSICMNCRTNLLLTYEFHCLCDQSEQYFLKRINKIDDDPFGNAIINNHSETINTEIKIENNFECDESNIDDIGVVVKSEIDCTDETSNDIIAEEIICSPIISQESLEFSSKRLPRTKQNVVVKNRFECFDCKECFYRVKELRQHMTKHNTSRYNLIGKQNITQKPFECTTCNIGFVHVNNWFRHRSKNHKNNIYECEHCSRAFNTLFELREHLPEMHKEHLDAYKCEQCSEEFALHFLLACHKERHKKNKQFKCSTCDAVFNTERKLNAHFRDNHQSHLCAECGKSFKTIHLLEHHQMVHNSKKPFACDLCPSEFKWQTSLKRHMLVHTGQKKHVCDICNKAFTTRGSMKHHKRIHTGERKYQCESCPMRFYSNGHLKRHKLTHTGERPHVCSYCSRSFSQSNDLTKHMRSHVGQNLFHCDCGASFRLKTELRRHSYTHYSKDNPDKSQTS